VADLVLTTTQMVVLVVRVVAQVLHQVCCVRVVLLQVDKVFLVVLHLHLMQLMWLQVVVVLVVLELMLKQVWVLLVEYQLLAQSTVQILLGLVVVVVVVSQVSATAQAVVAVQRMAGQIPMQQPTQVRVAVPRLTMRLHLEVVVQELLLLDTQSGKGEKKWHILQK
jgi:hypothetical protein